MPTLLLTGCAGFIGSNILEKVLNMGWVVIWLDNLATGHRKHIAPYLSNKNFVFVDGDVRDKALIEQLIDQYAIQYISHQAARWSVSKSVEDPLLSNDINVTGTLTILTVAKEKHIKKVVVAISSSIYGDTPTLPKIETMPYDPLSPYAITKVTKELYCRVFWSLHGLATIGLRYFNVYGKRQDPLGDYAAVIPRWIYNALSWQDLPLYGTGTQTRDFTYIDDVVDANIAALLCEDQSAFGRWYNICAGQQIAIKDLAGKIIQASGSTSQIVAAPARLGDIHDSYGSWDAAHRAFGYKPQHDMDSGLAATLDRYREHMSYFDA